MYIYMYVCVYDVCIWSAAGRNFDITGSQHFFRSLFFAFGQFLNQPHQHSPFERGEEGKGQAGRLCVFWSECFGVRG